MESLDERYKLEKSWKQNPEKINNFSNFNLHQKTRKVRYRVCYREVRRVNKIFHRDVRICSLITLNILFWDITGWRVNCIVVDSLKIAILNIEISSFAMHYFFEITATVDYILFVFFLVSIVIWCYDIAITFCMVCKIRDSHILDLYAMFPQLNLLHQLQRIMTLFVCDRR